MADNVRRLSSPDRARQQYLASLSAEQAVCMGQGHDWPKIKPGKALPRGIEAVPQHNGQFQVRETCPVCKTVRTWTTLPGGAFDLDIQYRYEHPKDWVTRHGDVEVTRRDIRADTWEQFGKLLAASNKPAKATGTS